MLSRVAAGLFHAANNGGLRLPAAPSYSSKEVKELMEQAGDGKEKSLLNATWNFMTATELNTDKFKFADMRNKNVEVNSNTCHDHLEFMGKTLAEAKRELITRKAEAKPSEAKRFDSIIHYCENAIGARLKALSPDDKYSVAYQNDNALKQQLPHLSSAAPSRR